jgi:hypothetical protein
MLRSWLIDEHGELVSERSLRHVGSITSLPELHDFYVSQIGAVSVTRGISTANVKFMKDTVSPDALVGLLRLLMEIRIESAIFEHPDHQHTIPMRRSYRGCVEYVAHLAEVRQQGARFLSWSVPVGISPFANRWAAAREVCLSVAAEDVRARLLEALFQGRYFLSELDTESGEFYVETMGSAYIDFKPLFGEGARSTLRAGFDTDYVNWSLDSYSKSRDSEAPRAHDIDALVSWPKTARRHRYARLTLPVFTLQQRFLLVATEARSGG